MAKKKGSALEQAGTPQAGMVGSTAMSLVQMLLQSGIDGRGPLESAEEVASRPSPARARSRQRSPRSRPATCAWLPQRASSPGLGDS